MRRVPVVRSRVIQILVTPAERAEIERRAGEAGYKALSSYARLLLLKGLQCANDALPVTNDRQIDNPANAT